MRLMGRLGCHGKHALIHSIISRHSWTTLSELCCFVSTTKSDGISAHPASYRVSVVGPQSTCRGLVPREGTADDEVGAGVLEVLDWLVDMCH